MPRRTPGHAFTLIELLVVITIIVVLLALLTPALDKAIYQAELTVCAAQLHGIANGAATYAFDQRRWYPHRPGIAGGPDPWPEGKPSQITDAWNGGEAQGKDDRPIFRAYIDLKLLADPLCERLDFDPKASDDDAFTYSGGQLFFGFGYKGRQGLQKLSDRLRWKGTNMFGRPVDGTFDFLAGDADAISMVNGGNHGSHPDASGQRFLWTLENDYAQSGTIGLGVDQGFKYYFSRWSSPAGADHRRGPMDLNFAHAGGEVTRVTGATWDDEEQVTTIPEFGWADETGSGGWWIVVEN